MAVVSHESSASSRHSWWWCIAIAVFFAAWALRTASDTTVVDTDAARHAMNGAFVYDLLATGNLLHPVEFGRVYYAHLPSLSIPYHPPLFPMVEALFFFLFGVNVPAARLAIAIAVAVSAIVLFRLVLATHKSVLIAAGCAVTFLSLPQSLRVGADVMLEFPALAFTLLALHCLSAVDKEYPMKRALTFALLAGGAVWMKQQAVFLGAVPFLYVALIGQWRLFRKREIWASSALFTALVAGLVTMSLPFKGAGVTHAMPAEGTLHVLSRNFKYYINHYPEGAGPAGVVLVIAFAAAAVTGLVKRRETALYVAWAVSALMLLFLLGPFNTRYLFFVFPALFLLGYLSLSRAGERWSSLGRFALIIPVVLLAPAWSFLSSWATTPFLRGPEELARVLGDIAPRRILYCGNSDGSFMFELRAVQRNLKSTVIAGAKLPPSVFTPAGIDEFARRYGVQYIVLEHTVGNNDNRRWKMLADSVPESMVLERDIKLTRFEPEGNGVLRLYRFKNPSLQPHNDLMVQMNMIGGSMLLKLPN